MHNNGKYEKIPNHLFCGVQGREEIEIKTNNEEETVIIYGFGRPIPRGAAEKFLSDTNTILEKEGWFVVGGMIYKQATSLAEFLKFHHFGESWKAVCERIAEAVEGANIRIPLMVPAGALKEKDPFLSKMSWWDPENFIKEVKEEAKRRPYAEFKSLASFLQAAGFKSCRQ